MNKKCYKYKIIINNFTPQQFLNRDKQKGVFRKMTRSDFIKE